MNSLCMRVVMSALLYKLELARNVHGKSRRSAYVLAALDALFVDLVRRLLDKKYAICLFSVRACSKLFHVFLGASPC